MKIDCELEIVPKQSDSSSVRLVLRVHGAVVYDHYEHEMAVCEKDFIGRIVAAHSRVYGQFADRLCKAD